MDDIDVHTMLIYTPPEIANYKLIKEYEERQETSKMERLKRFRELKTTRTMDIYTVGLIIMELVFQTPILQPILIGLYEKAGLQIDPDDNGLETAALEKGVETKFLESIGDMGE